jgi:hypothetical protein
MKCDSVQTESFLLPPVRAMALPRDATELKRHTSIVSRIALLPGDDLLVTSHWD